ncbi:hypothetical protein [Pseudobacteroides cellulosolvens]|nr:hypothetical protein [Pseudobacteroides cellulosolvens]
MHCRKRYGKPLRNIRGPVAFLRSLSEVASGEKPGKRPSFFRKANGAML